MSNCPEHLDLMCYSYLLMSEDKIKNNKLWDTFTGDVN